MGLKQKLNPLSNAGFNLVPEDEGANSHEKNKDQYLDQGGVNQIAVTEVTKKLTANVNYYINPDTGNDSNPGTSGSPFLTVAKAISLLPLNLNYKTANIYLQPSLNYTEAILLSGFYNMNSLNLRRASGEVLITNAAPVYVRNCSGKVLLGAFNLKTIGTNKNCILVGNCAFVEISGTVKLSDDGSAGTTGIKADRSLVGVTSAIGDYDANKVETGLQALNGAIIYTPASPTFGDTYLSTANTGEIIVGSGKHLIDADLDDAVTKKHSNSLDHSNSLLKGTLGEGLFLDQQVLNDNTQLNMGKGKFAQTFIPSISGESRKIILNVGKQGTPPAGFTVELRTVDVDGKPTDTVLATVTKPALEMAEGWAETEFVFDSPYSVVSGTKYALVMYGSSDETEWVDYYQVRLNESSTYLGDAFILYSSQPTTWYVQPGDWFFKIYIYGTGLQTLIEDGALKTNLAVDAGLKLDSVLESNQTFAGTIISLTAGEELIFGDVCYIDSNGKANKIDATQIVTMPGLVMCVDATIATDVAGNFLLLGTARDDSWSWTPGGLIYGKILDSSGETMSQTPPTGTDAVVQVLGVALSATTILFKPDLSLVELA